jgi:hypothetical protein
MSYLNSLSLENTDSSANDYVSIQDVSNVEYIYINGKNIMAPPGQRISMTDLSTNDISGCQAVCLSLSNCTGATFNSNSGSCVAYSGDYTLVNSKDTANYALFPIKTQLLIQLRSYNSQLLSLNDQILRNLKNTQPTFDKEIELNNIAQINAIGYKEKLLAQEIEILKLMEEQDQYTEDKNDTYKVVNKYYLQYKIGIFVIILLIILTLVIFQGVDRRLFIVAIVISCYFIFNFNILTLLLVLVSLKLIELNFLTKEGTQ